MDPLVPAIMFQGTGSDVGKSLIVAGLARAFTRRGFKVRPFKPQNMSNNAAVTADGGEIGRAQALQARACGIASSLHMNPVLLKPECETGAQVIVQGRRLGSAKAADYHRMKKDLLPAILDSFRKVGEGADLILVEGAGSPAEINLRAGDVANMGFACAAQVPVILVGDIDRGGIMASILGTKALLPEDEARRLKGFIVNKFRGDPALFADGRRIIAERTQLADLGLVPWFADARRLPAEDAMALENFRRPGFQHPVNGAIKIAVPRLPRISNFDDLDPLSAEPGVALDLVEPGRALPGDADLILLPGSKATIADLAALRAEGWDIDLLAHRRRGGRILGLCGGYQMLGRRIADPAGIEGTPTDAPGLGLLDIETILTAEKTLVEVAGRDLASGAGLRGYEMHVGTTDGPDCRKPMLDLGGRMDGARSDDGRVMGCYVHGLFASDEFRRAFLARLKPGMASDLAYERSIEETLDALAAHLERHVALDRIWEVANAR